MPIDEKQVQEWMIAANQHAASYVPSAHLWRYLFDAEYARLAAKETTK